MSTDSSQVNKDLEKLQLALEEAEREMDQLREQLVQQNKMAALGTLVAGVAHDINTPLGSVKANVDLASKLSERIRKRSPADDAKLVRSLDALDDSVSTLKLATERIRVIVGSLRTFARQSGTELVETNLHEGLDSSLQLVGHMMEKRIIVNKVYGDLPLVRCRPGELNQVFMNLLTNAVQAIEGEGEITVTTRVDGDDIEISIEDTGIGISEENKAKLFKAGFTTKGASVGTGLGLAITCRLVRGHGGSISVTSEPGKGTCFSVRMPIAGPPADALASAQADD